MTLPPDIKKRNGFPLCQGRLIWWNPGGVEGKKALPSSHPEILVRFAKEASVKKAELFPDIDIMDVAARQEPLKVRGEPQMLQLPLVPAYALTIHKTQVCGLHPCYLPGLRRASLQLPGANRRVIAHGAQGVHYEKQLLCTASCATLIPLRPCRSSIASTAASRPLS